MVINKNTLSLHKNSVFQPKKLFFNKTFILMESANNPVLSSLHWVKVIRYS